MNDVTSNEQLDDSGLIIAVFDSKTMALRTAAELHSAEFHDLWIGIVSGETLSGHTMIARDGEGGEELLLQHVLIARGARAAHAHRFNAILPPGTAVMTLSVSAKLERAIQIIEVSGGHIEDF